MQNRSSIFIIDDNPLVRKSLVTYLSSISDFIIIGEEEAGECALNLIFQYLPDLVLMDLKSSINSINTIHQIKWTCPRTKVVVFTSAADEETELSALIAGASACLSNEMNPKLLLVAIQKVINDQPNYSPNVAALILRKLNHDWINNVDPSSAFSEQEEYILQLKAMGFSNRKISQKLSTREKIVIGHLSNILQKLHMIGRVQGALKPFHENS